MAQYTIKIASSFGNILNTRDEAIELKNQSLHILSASPSNTKIIVDFLGVDFMSRSFADQFYKENRTLIENFSCEIILTNLDEQITEVMSAVSRTQNKTNRSFAESPIYSFTDREKLDNYLQAL